MATWKRILVEGDVAGDGVISVSGTAPHTVSLGDPTSGDTTLTTLAYNNITNSDYLLIWDASATDWKKTLYTSIPSVNLGNSNLSQSDPNRTFDIANGGKLEFVANNGATFQISGENSQGTEQSIIKIGNAVEAFSDDGDSFGGINISSTSETGNSVREYGLWIEGGYHDATSEESPVKIVLERSYKLNTAAPQNGDEIARIEFIAPYDTTGSGAWEDGAGSEFYDGEGAIYGVISSGILTNTNPTKGYIDLKLNNDVVLSDSSPTTEQTAVLRVDTDGVRINAAETIDGTLGTPIATNKDFYLPTDRGLNGQVLHTGGNGTTYWDYTVDNVVYDSEWVHAGVSTQDLPFTTAVATVTLYTLNIPNETATGVEIVEGTDITIDGNTTNDYVEFAGLPPAASSGNVTIQGTMYMQAQTSGAVGLYLFASGIDGDNQTKYYTNSNTGDTLFTASYGAATSQTSGIGGGAIGLGFTTTIPAIGTMSDGDAIEKLRFVFKVRRFQGSGQHSYRLENLKITLNA